MLSPIFVSHGAPTLPFEDVPARHFLEGLGARMARPNAILAVSAHWETQVPMVNSVARNQTIHDFYGFPAPLYELEYPAPGSPDLANEVAGLVADAGLPVRIDGTRGLDHGAWVPLMLAWPAADIPVVQLSVQSHLGPGHHLALGRALQPLTQAGVLILASGSFTHDLSSFRSPLPDGEPDWVTSFADWMDAAIMRGATCDLLSYREQAPNARRNHPTEEHLLPLFVALGAAGEGAVAEHLHSSTTYSVLRMDAYAFGRKVAA